MVRELAYEGGLIEAAGGSIHDIPDLHQREGMLGLRDQLMLQALARHAIIAWQGIADEDGAPLAVTPEAVDALMRDHPAIAARFETEYLRELRRCTPRETDRAPLRLALRRRRRLLRTLCRARRAVRRRSPLATTVRSARTPNMRRKRLMARSPGACWPPANGSGPAWTVASPGSISPAVWRVRRQRGADPHVLEYLLAVGEAAAVSAANRKEDG